MGCGADDENVSEIDDKALIPSFTVTPEAKLRENPGLITWQQLMETDNRFYSDIAEGSVTFFARYQGQDVMVGVTLGLMEFE